MKSHKNAVVIIPPEEVWEPIQKIRKEHDRTYWRWMPHITLLYPFRPSETHTVLKRHFEEQLFSFPAFKLKLKKISYFMSRNSSFTIWLQPDPARQISQLQAELQQIVPDCDEVHKFAGGFHPHLTIASGRGTDQFKQLLREITKQWRPVTFQVSSVYLVSRDTLPEKPFTITETVNFS
ncbi:MAG: 2'-5' RNA ligase family protein [Deferribacteres bacterium]|nr:2'-5' RNA ligase family protein [candidate division KSB1 bacterium]MCB9502442.1 2'-5' RNA ligase family protein [Deferribacteres bacterium]